MSDLPGNCHFCGDLECDLQACADCHKSFCHECIDWCYDQTNGGQYLCSGCLVEWREKHVAVLDINLNDEMVKEIERLKSVNAELLEACLKVLERLDYAQRKDVYVSDDSRVIMQAIVRAAIAKATGGVDE